MITTCALASDITAQYFEEANMVIVKGVTDKVSNRKPVTLMITDGSGESLYTSQMRAYNSSFQFKFPIMLDVDELDEYIAKVNVNGNYNEIMFTQGVAFDVSKKWSNTDKTLTVSGNFVYEGYCDSSDVEISVEDASGSIVYTDTYSVDEKFAYEFVIDFASLGFSEYTITVTTEKDSEKIAFSYAKPEDLVAKLDGLKPEDLKVSLNDSVEMLGIDTWLTIDGSVIETLSDEVYDILANGLEDVDDVAELKMAVNRAILTDKLNSSLSAEESKEISETRTSTNELCFDITDLEVYDVYEAFEDEEKTNVFEAVTAKGLTSFDEISTNLNKRILYNPMKECNDWSLVKVFVGEYYQIMGIDTDVSNQVFKDIDDLIVGFESLDDFIDKYNELAKADKEGKEDEDDDDDEKGNNNYRGPSLGSSTITNNNPPAVVTPVVPPVIFDDIADVQWAELAITELYKKGIVNGVADKKFDPNAPVTREQFVKMLVIAFNITENGEGNVEFSDVNFLKDWFASYVKLAATNGIVTGKGDGTFGVGEAITRQDAATLIYRLVTVAEGEEIAKANFADASRISDYAKEAVNYLCAKNVINGVGNGNFEPMNVCSRAQAAKIIYQVLAIK